MTLAEAEAPRSKSTCPDVRLGRIEDRPAIFDLLKIMAAENAIFPINWAKVTARIDQALNPEIGTLIGVSTLVEDGKEVICGAICLDMTSMWYSDILFINDVFNFVDPKYRERGKGIKGSLARQQLRFAKMVAAQFGMPLLIAIMSTIRTGLKMNLYEAEKFTQVGGQFAYIPDDIKHLFRESWQLGSG